MIYEGFKLCHAFQKGDRAYGTSIPTSIARHDSCLGARPDIFIPQQLGDIRVCQRPLDCLFHGIEYLLDDGEEKAVTPSKLSTSKFQLKTCMDTPIMAKRRHISAI
jgi:hypothetical protein